MSEALLATEWQKITFPRDDGSKLAAQVYNNLFLPAELARGAIAYFDDNPMEDYLTIITAGQRVPPDTSAFYVTLRAIEKAGGVFHGKEGLVLDRDYEVQKLEAGLPPLAVRSDLPELEELRRIRRIASHDERFRTENPKMATGIGYVALYRDTDTEQIVCRAGYGNLRTGERAEKPLHFDEIQKREKLQSGAVTKTNLISIPGLGPVL